MSQDEPHHFDLQIETILENERKANLSWLRLSFEIKWLFQDTCARQRDYIDCQQRNKMIKFRKRKLHLIKTMKLYFANRGHAPSTMSEAKRFTSYVSFNHGLPLRLKFLHFSSLNLAHFPRSCVELMVMVPLTTRFQMDKLTESIARKEFISDCADWHNIFPIQSFSAPQENKHFTLTKLKPLPITFFIQTLPLVSYYQHYLSDMAGCR